MHLLILFIILEAYSTLRRLVDSTSDLGRVPALEERMQLSHDVFKLDNTELARVLTIIEASSPNALARKSSSDEVRTHPFIRLLIHSPIHSLTHFCRCWLT